MSSSSEFDSSEDETLRVPKYVPSSESESPQVIKSATSSEFDSSKSDSIRVPRYAPSSSSSNIEDSMDEDFSDATGYLADVSSSDDEVQHKDDSTDAAPTIHDNDGSSSDVSGEVSQEDISDLENYPATFSCSDETVKPSAYVAAAMANCRNKMVDSSVPESDSEGEIDNKPEREKLRIFLAYYNHGDKPKKTWNEFEADDIVNKSNVRNWFNDGCDTEEYMVKKGPGFTFNC